MPNHSLVQIAACRDVVMAGLVKLLLPALAVAQKLDVEKLKAEKGYKIVEYDITAVGFKDLRYVIDPQACVCVVSRQDAAVEMLSAFDCKNLLHHDELAKYVKDCVGQ